MAESKNKKIIKKVSTKVGIKKVVKKVTKKKVAKIKKRVELTRALHNPIISPRLYPWESKATFNPTAFLGTGKIHLIYRAIGHDDSSVLGYAGSHDGYNIIDRPTYTIFMRRNNFNRVKYTVAPIDYISGGGWNGGCEDPRVTRIDDTVYLLYIAFDGWGSVRIALTSIAFSDFEAKRWQWKNPILISPPNEIHKNWVIFPEKVKGKYAILHSISPKILIHYFDSFDEFDGKKFINSIHQGSPEWQSRERGVRGVGPAPIKTELGWLMLYHKIEEHDPGRYKIWAMILDSEDPTKVLYKSPEPILEPDEDYENNGCKWGVIYTCGAVVKNDRLFVYYGGADMVVGVATILLTELLEDLKKHKVVKFKKYVTRI